MTVITNSDNEKKENKNNSSSKKNNTSSTFDKERYDILKHKYLIQKYIKEDNKKQKEKEAEYKELFGAEKFGDIKMSDKEKEEYFKLKQNFEHEQGKIGIEKIKKINAELVRAPLSEKFDNFIQQDPNRDLESTAPSVEQVRIMLSALPSELLSIFNEYFTISFYNTVWQNPNNKDGAKTNELMQQTAGGAIVEKYQDNFGKKKFRINLDVDVFTTTKEEIHEGIEFLRSKYNKVKFLYIINRCILSTIKNKEEFVEFAKKNEKLCNKKLDKNCETNLDDWLAFFLASPEEAKKINPELYEVAKKWLKKGFEEDDFMDYDRVSSKTIIKPAKFNSQIFKNKKVWKDSETGEKIEDKGWLNFLNLTESVGLSFLGSGTYGIVERFKEIKLAFEEGYLYAQTEEAEKEVKRLMGKELSCGDYQKLLRKPLYYNNEDKMKALIFVLAKKSAYHWQFGQLWLLRWDPVFKRTAGKEISLKGFDFINRVSGISGSENKIVKTSEYKQVGNKFVHVKWEDQIARFDNIFETFSLRDIQRAKPDLFNNLFCPEKNMFLPINSKLGEVNIDGKDKYYIQNDVNLKDILPKGEADNFIKNMQEFSKKNNEEGFNRLVDPVVVSMVKKYLQESRREPMLFSMYTSPMVRRGFEYYKNFVDEPESSKNEYKRDFELLKNDLEQSNYDPEEVIENKAYEDIDSLYKNYGKEENELPYTRGKEKTKFGKIKELMRQSQIKVEKLIYKLSIPDELKNYINSQLIKFNEQSQIPVEEINEFNNNINKQLSQVDSVQSRRLRMIIDEHLKDLERYSIIRGYQSVFRPYESVIHKSTAYSSIDSKKAESIKKWYLMELLPEKGSINQKIIDLENYSEGKISFSENEKRYLNSLNSPESLNELTEILYKKLSKSKLSKEDVFINNYQELNNSYFNANQALLYPNQFENETPKIIDNFKSLSFIPQSVKDNTPNTIKDILSKLRIAKVIADDIYSRQQLKKQYKRGQDLFGYDPMMEYENEYEEELATAA